MILLLPLLALLLFGFFWPLARAVHASLTGGEYLGSEFARLWSDPILWLILRRTLAVAGLVTVLCLVLAYPTAEFINSASRFMRPVLLALVVIPLWTGTVPRTYSWVGFFQLDGIVDRIASLFGVGPQHLLFTRLAVTVGMVQVMLPLLILPIYAALRRYDERLSMASLSLGAGRFRTFWRVKLPVLGPQIAAGATLIFVLSLGFFITPAILGGPNSSMISTLIYQQFFGRYDLTRASAISVVLLVTTLAVLGALTWLVFHIRRRVS